MEVEIDEALLQHIADLTNGKYFRATNNEKLEAIYKEIDKLEKSKIDVMEYSKKTEKFFHFYLSLLFPFLIELTARYLVYKSIP